MRGKSSRYDVEPGNGVLHLMHRKETASDALVEKRRRVERGERRSEELDGTYVWPPEQTYGLAVGAGSTRLA